MGRNSFKLTNAVILYTDGSCLENPGPGGWAAILRWRDEERELSGGKADSTNNRMELMAAIVGLEALNRASEVCLTTDSKYVRDGINSWIDSWKKKGWKTSSGNPVKNRDLWERLDRARMSHRIDWNWVKGHSGHLENDRADALANRGIDELGA